MREIEDYRKEERLDFLYSLLTDPERGLQIREDLEESNRKLTKQNWELSRQITERTAELRELEEKLLDRQLQYQVLRDDEERLSGGRLATEFSDVLWLLQRMEIFGRSKPAQYPDYRGVYVLYRDLELRYVGESTKIRNRLPGHHYRDFTTVKCLRFDGDDRERRKVEARFITACNPPENGQRPADPGPLNLKEFPFAMTPEERREFQKNFSDDMITHSLLSVVRSARTGCPFWGEHVDSASSMSVWSGLTGYHGSA